jgi:hypothetical protein
MIGLRSATPTYTKASDFAIQSPNQSSHLIYRPPTGAIVDHPARMTTRSRSYRWQFSSKVTWHLRTVSDVRRSRTN